MHINRKLSYTKEDSDECPITFQCNCDLGTCRLYIVYTNIILLINIVLSLLPLVLITEKIENKSCNVIDFSYEKIFLANTIICLIYYIFVMIFYNSIEYLKENIGLHKLLKVLIALLFTANLGLTIVSNISFCDNCISNDTKNIIIFPLIFNYVTIISSIQYIINKSNKKK